MYKPKNINIKKLTQQQQQTQEGSKVQQSQTRKNSRKSLNTLNREGMEHRPSPIHAMKNNTCEDEDSSMEQANFIACVNGYLNTLDSGKGSRRDGNLANLKTKIRREKQINRNLQKNIIELQRVLWERTQKLDALEESVNRLENKQNRMSLGNTTNFHSKSKTKLLNKRFGCSANSQYSQGSDSELTQFQEDRYQKRRKTELPAEIQKMISQTMGIRSKKLKN